MGIVTCPDCQNEVSDQAPSCPNCGRPIRGGRGTEQSPDVIEETGKRWKRMQVYGALGAIVGVSVATVGGAQEAGTTITIGVLLLVAGVGAFVTARIGAWWHHG